MHSATKFAESTKLTPRRAVLKLELKIILNSVQGPVKRLLNDDERDLKVYLDTYQVDIGDVTTFEARLRTEIANLEAANVHALCSGAREEQVVVPDRYCLPRHRRAFWTLVS